MEAKEGVTSPSNGRKPLLPREGVGHHNGLVQALGHKEWNVLGSIWGGA